MYDLEMSPNVGQLNVISKSIKTFYFILVASFKDLSYSKAQKMLKCTFNALIQQQ